MKEFHPAGAVVVLVDDELMVTRSLAALLELEADYQGKTLPAKVLLLGWVD